MQRNLNIVGGKYGEDVPMNMRINQVPLKIPSEQVPFKKSRIRDTPTLSTDAESRTDTIFEKLLGFFFKEVA